MPPRHLLPLTILCAVFVAPCFAFAHGDLHESIDLLTQKIASQQGTDAALYLQRGEYYRLHKDWTAAKADFDRAEALDSRLGSVDFCRARLLIDTGERPAALSALDRFLARYPFHAEARLTRAALLQAMGRNADAASDFRFAIEHAPDPRPELFIDQAALLKSTGQDVEALATLDAGIRRLGILVTLQLPAIDLELKLHRTEAALARVDKLASGNGRAEIWLLRRAEILEEAGRREEARAAMQSAAAALKTLPAHRRATQSHQELEARIEAARIRLSRP